MSILSEIKTLVRDFNNLSNPKKTDLRRDPKPDDRPKTRTQP
jgi:hypothetical protein